MSEPASNSSKPAVPLSVLDLSPVPAGGTATDALRNSIDLARAAERAGSTSGSAGSTCTRSCG